MTFLPWIGIIFCLTQSAMFSGLNLAFFSLGRLHLEAEAKQGCPDALKILLLRTRSNLLLCTILWGNVSVNVALAMLSGSVMTGVVAFAFSTFGITFIGEIIPQAYFSRNALKMGSLLAPVIRFYQIILWPVARPSAWVLDKWIGQEGAVFLDEEDFEVLLDRHINERETDIGHAEGRGALNFLRIDDLRVSGEGSSIAPESIMPISSLDDIESFRQHLQSNTWKWIVLTEGVGEMPKLVLNADEFLRQPNSSPTEFCHIPIVVQNPEATLDTVLTQLVVETETPDDRLIDREVILYWGSNSRRIITGPDILGRLLNGIAQRILTIPDTATNA
ncbi:MAG: metal transporter CNNM [Verrucomicrobiales bacterium]|jgi:metal transporter CNNM